MHKEMGMQLFSFLCNRNTGRPWGHAVGPSSLLFCIYCIYLLTWFIHHLFLQDSTQITEYKMMQSGTVKQCNRTRIREGENNANNCLQAQYTTNNAECGITKLENGESPKSEPRGSFLSTADRNSGRAMQELIPKGQGLKLNCSCGTYQKAFFNQDLCKQHSYLN